MGISFDLILRKKFSDMSVEILFLNLAKSLQDQVLKGLSLWYIVEGLDTSRTENTTLFKNHYETD